MDIRPNHGPLQDSFVHIPNTRFPTTEETRLYNELIRIYGQFTNEIQDTLLASKRNIDNAIEFPHHNAIDSRANLIQKLEQLKKHVKIAYGTDHNFNRLIAKINELILVLEGSVHPELKEESVGYPRLPGQLPDQSTEIQPQPMGPVSPWIPLYQILCHLSSKNYI